MTITQDSYRTEDQLILPGKLSEMAQLPSWIERLASRYAVPDNIRFAIDLCLEEAVANVIVHGYAGDPDRSVHVRFSQPREGYFVFVIDDDAQQFNPLVQPELPAIDPDDQIRIGGQGIRLLRRFTDELEYEPTPNGNRLRMGFAIDGAAARAQ